MIREWVQENIKSGRLQSGGREYVIPSLFYEDDWKMHMSINLETGLWRCFKSGETGNFYKLVSLVRGVPYQKGKEVFYSFCIENGKLPEESEAKIIIPESKSITHSEFVEVEEGSSAWNYLQSRSLNPTRFYECNSGKFKGRVIIPFEDRDGLFYFTARSLSPDTFPKYLNPASEEGVKASHVLYPYAHSEEPLYVTEGAFDAIAIKEAGMNATCTNGCSPSVIQMQYLKAYPGEIVIAYDNDEAGREGLERFERLRKRLCIDNISYVFPEGEKDWNSILINKGESALRQTLQNYKKYSWENNMDVIVSAL
jgi:hypothetical protein